MRARPNRAGNLQAFRIDKNVGLAPEEIEDGATRFKDWHWGIEPAQVVDWDDPDMPKSLIECGRLVQLHVRAPRAQNNPRHPRRERDTMIEFSRAISNTSHIAFDPNHVHERLYLLVPDRAQSTLKRRFWDENNASPMLLNQLASVAGGHHGKLRDYPNLKVKPIGILTGVVYRTWKKGDENPGENRSYYIHRLGEVTGGYPILSVDEVGRLWIAGGSYEAPDPGIQN